MWVLLIEDDDETARGIELMLKSQGHDCQIERQGEDGLDTAKLYNFDIILLDLMLPGMGGLEVLRRLRANRIGTPVLIISGLSDTGFKSEGLNSGADDYLAKPFDNRELLARIEAVMRRSQSCRDTVIRTGVMDVNLDAQTVMLGGQSVPVTRKEYQILELLSQRKGMVLTKEMFLNHLYGGIDEPVLKIIDVFICKVRKKLAAITGGEHYIRTVWGSGYMLCESTPRALDDQDSPTAMSKRMAA